MTLTRSALALVFLTLATPCFAQDLELRCEVYRFSDRSQVFAKGRTLKAADLRQKGRLRYEATLPFQLGTRANISSGRRIAFRTQTTSQGVISTSVQFLEVRDSLEVEARRGEKGKPSSLSLQLNLQDVMQGQSEAGLPVVQQRQLQTRVGLELGREILQVQGGLTGTGQSVQVVILRVVALEPKPAKKAPPAPERLDRWRGPR